MLVVRPRWNPAASRAARPAKADDGGVEQVARGLRDDEGDDHRDDAQQCEAGAVELADPPQLT
jgi:hypothetical protein